MGKMMANKVGTPSMSSYFAAHGDCGHYCDLDGCPQQIARSTASSRDTRQVAYLPILIEEGTVMFIFITGFWFGLLLLRVWK